MDSQNTLFSLQQLEPSPVESPLDTDKQLPDAPEPAPLARSSTLGLSGSGHGAVYYLSRAQRYSSYAFTVYAAFHITNTSIIPLITQSVSSSENYLLLTRPYYQSPLLEPLMVALPLATHILSGLALRIHRRNISLRRYGGSNLPISKRLSEKRHIWPALSASSISGYILVPLVYGHIFVNRALPLIYEGGSSSVGLGYVSHGFAKHPILAWTGYAALVGIGVGHIVWGWAKWLNWTPVGSGNFASNGKQGKRRWWTINGISFAVTALWMAGGLGVVGRGGKADGWIGKGYDELFAKIPLLKL